MPNLYDAGEAVNGNHTIGYCAVTTSLITKGYPVHNTEGILFSLGITYTDRVDGDVLIIVRLYLKKIYIMIIIIPLCR